MIPMIENIVDNEIVIAIIVYKEYQKEGITFFTPKDFSLQLGYMNRPSDYLIKPHMHNPVQRKTVGTQEVLFIKNGVISVDFFSSDQTYITSRQLSAGDIILFASEGGHGIKVLETATIVEVKNGPYVEDADKGRFEGIKG
jgi:hypothetical protein